LRKGVFRPVDDVSKNIKSLSVKDIDEHVREQSGFEWIISGEKAHDSIVRRAMLKKCRGVDERRKRCFPLTAWSTSTVFNYVKRNKIFLPSDYGMFGNSFGKLWYEELSQIKKHYPDDYQKILEVFPYAESAIKRFEFYGDKISKILVHHRT
jgi:phosphoadenosine phosphosulfate reductase